MIYKYIIYYIQIDIMLYTFHGKIRLTDRCNITSQLKYPHVGTNEDKKEINNFKVERSFVIIVYYNVV